MTLTQGTHEHIEVNSVDSNIFRNIVSELEGVNVVRQNGDISGVGSTAQYPSRDAKWAHSAKSSSTGCSGIGESVFTYGYSNHDFVITASLGISRRFFSCTSKH